MLISLDPIRQLMRFGIVLVLIIALSEVCGAQVYLDTIIDFGVEYPRRDGSCRNALKYLGSDTYRGAFRSASNQNLSFEIVIADFDLFGAISNTTRIGDTTEVFWPRSWIELDNDTVVLLSRYNKPYDPTYNGDQYCLMALNFYSGEIYWRHEYGALNNSDFPFGLAEAEDGGFLMTGAAYNPVTEDNNVYTVKVDHFGNQVWESYAGGPDNDVAYSIIPQSDGGYLLGGRTRSYGNGNYDVYVLKLDSIGNELWHETFGGANWDGAIDMIESQNGNYLLVGARNERSYLLLIDSAANVIWDQAHSNPARTSLISQVRELESGRFITCGISNDLEDGSNAGYAMLNTINGALIWERYFNRSSGVDYFTNAVQCEDGGFLFVGQANPTGYSDAWILKVDSAGCPFPNCLSGIDEEEKLILLDVWPNPATNILNIELSPVVRELALSVFTLDGSLQFKQTLVQSSNKIDVSEWSSGVYILSGIDEEGRNVSLKFVKD